MIKKWFQNTTPFVILSVFAAIIILYEIVFEGAGFAEWRVPVIFKLLIFLAVIIIIDVILKFYIKCSNAWIWFIELFSCLGFIYYWIIS